MAKSNKSATRKVGESDVKSLDGLSFGKRDALPARTLAKDPARMEAAQTLVKKLRAGETASDSKGYPSRHAAELAAMVYVRLARLDNKTVINTRVSQNADGTFNWFVFMTPPAKKTVAPAAATS